MAAQLGLQDALIHANQSPDRYVPTKSEMAELERLNAVDIELHDWAVREFRL